MTRFTTGLRTSLNPAWTTPKDLFNQLNTEFNFTLDAAALSINTLVPNNWFGPDHPERKDALNCDWLKCSGGGWIFLNPPYGTEISKFMKKANEEVARGAKIVALVPARTDTRWWHDYCIQHKIRFIKGRLKFGDGKNSAPFPSALIIMEAM